MLTTVNTSPLTFPFDRETLTVNSDDSVGFVKNRHNISLLGLDAGATLGAAEVLQ